MIGRLVARELRRGFSGPAWLPAAFFLLVATLIPFAVGPDAMLLARIGAGALWIAALTAAGTVGGVAAEAASDIHELAVDFPEAAHRARRGPTRRTPAPKSARPYIWVRP